MFILLVFFNEFHFIQESISIYVHPVFANVYESYINFVHQSMSQTNLCLFERFTCSQVCTVLLQFTFVTINSFIARSTARGTFSCFFCHKELHLDSDRTNSCSYFHKLSHRILAIKNLLFKVQNKWRCICHLFTAYTYILRNIKIYVEYK